MRSQSASETKGLMAYPPLREIAPHRLKEQFVCHWLIFSERS
jgi:hypothetical protein